MQRTQPSRPRAPQTRCLLGGICVLSLYLVTATPLAPALTALVAASDCSHNLVLQQSAHGLQVVLRHDCPVLPMHRHGMVARTLTIFAQHTTAPESDHVIQFGTTDTAQQEPALALDPASNWRAPNEAVVCDSVRHAADLPTLEPTAFPRPPPATGGLLLNVRSTVLLI